MLTHIYCPWPPPPSGDSSTFVILPVGGNPQHVEILCNQGTHTGKYLVVKPNMDVIAGSASDGDTVFQRATVLGSVPTITLSYPAVGPTHYLAFESVSREAQLEELLTDRSHLEVVDSLFRTGGGDGTDVPEDVSASSELLIDTADSVQSGSNRKAEA